MKSTCLGMACSMATLHLEAAGALLDIPHGHEMNVKDQIVRSSACQVFGHTNTFPKERAVMPAHQGPNRDTSNKSELNGPPPFLHHFNPFISRRYAARDKAQIVAHQILLTVGIAALLCLIVPQILIRL